LQDLSLLCLSVSVSVSISLSLSQGALNVGSLCLSRRLVCLFTLFTYASRGSVYVAPIVSTLPITRIQTKFSTDRTGILDPSCRLLAPIVQVFWDLSYRFFFQFYANSEWTLSLSLSLSLSVHYRQCVADNRDSLHHSGAFLCSKLLVLIILIEIPCLHILLYSFHGMTRLCFDPAVTLNLVRVKKQQSIHICWKRLPPLVPLVLACQYPLPLL
jgi:hypothetical protein